MERAVLLADGRSIGLDAIPSTGDQQSVTWADVPDDARALAKEKQELRSSAVDRVERLFVIKALRAAGWNVSQAARNVDMARPNLHALMRKHGISSPSAESSEADTPDEGDAEES